MHKRINVGYIGWLSYDGTPYSRPHAVCDINESKLRGYREKHPEVRCYADYRQMAEDPGLNAVIISTPNWLHCEMAIAFLEKGKHVFCEKPMGVNREELDRMLLAQRRSGRELAIDFELRVSAGPQRIKAIMDSGELGEIKGFEFIHHRGCWLAEGAMAWRVKPKISGGLFFMEVCHEVDLLRWYLGEITHVQSICTPNVLPQYEDGIPDNVYTHFWLESGAMAHFATTHTLSDWDAKEEEYDQKGHDMYLILTGTRGALRYDAIKRTLLVTKYVQYPQGSHGCKPVFDRIETLSDPHASHNIDGNRQAFLKAVAAGQPHHQDAADAWRSHVACLAAEHSATSRFQRIAIDFTGQPA